MLNFVKPQKIGLALLEGKYKKIQYVSEASNHDRDNVKVGAYWLASGVSFYWDQPIVAEADLVLSYFEAYKEGLVGLPAEITNVVVREKDSVLYYSIREMDGVLAFVAYTLFGGRALGAYVYKCAIENLSADGLELAFSRQPGKIAGGTIDEKEAAQGAATQVLLYLSSLSAAGTSLTPATRHSSQLIWRDKPLKDRKSVV